MKSFWANNKLTIFGIILIAAAVVGGYVGMSEGSVGEDRSEQNTQTTSGWEDVRIADQQSPTNNNSTTTQEENEPSAGTASVNFSDPKTFTHPQRNFTFQYPRSFNVGRIDESDGETIVVQNPGEQVGFQIYLRPIDEPIQMTAERIQQDLPDLEVRQPQPVQLGENAGQGLAFYSSNEAFGGNSREVWFTFDGYLYQISTYANQDPLLKQVLSSWTFK